MERGLYCWISLLVLLHLHFVGIIITMRQSNIEIQQSIYQSQRSHKPTRRELLLEGRDSYAAKGDLTKTRPGNKQGGQGTQGIQGAPQGYKVGQVQDPTFMRFYEENIELKMKQEQMKAQIQLLKSQLQKKTTVTRAAQQAQLKLLASKKSLYPTKAPTPSRPHPSRPNPQSLKIQSLLQIIDSYKQKLMTAEEEISNLKRQKKLMDVDGRVRDRREEGYHSSVRNRTQNLQRAFELQERIKNSEKLLQIQKQRNKFHEADVRRLETKVKTLEIQQGEVEDIKLENRSLEEKLMRLTSLPSFSHVTDKVDEQRKLKQLQSKISSITQKYTDIKTTSIKTQSQLKVLQNKLIETTHQAHCLQKQNQQLKRFSLENPIICQLAKNQQLLATVVYEIRNGQRGQDRGSLLERQSYEKIVMEKEMLANQLTVLRAKIGTMQQNWKQRQRIAKIQKQEMISSLKQQMGSAPPIPTRAVSKNGVAYTDDISMFTQQPAQTPPNTNYFDLYIGQLYLLQTMLVTNFNLHNPQSSLMVATVDFYNHSTETTRPVHGTHCDLKSQFGFRVLEDQFFFRYLGKDSFTIQIWCSQSNKRLNVGKVTVPLNPLISKSKKNLSPVVNLSAPIYHKDKVMGSINFVMRMRLPIFDQLKNINEINQVIATEDSPNRKLVIEILEGRGFQVNANTFVYFPFRLQDYYTRTFKGSNPAWNFHKIIDLNYNIDLKNYLRKTQLELVVLDDNAIITGQGDSDVVGSAYLPLVPLLEGTVIKERLTIVKGTQKVGHVDVKIYWYQFLEGEKQVEKIEMSNLDVLKQQINNFMESRNVDPDTIFRQIDRNGSNMISFEQFYTWTLKIAPKTTYDTASAFYSQFPQPLNRINFSSRLNSNAHPIQSTETTLIAKQLSQINKLFMQNTQMIKNKQPFHQWMKGKSIDLVGLDIDRSGNGRISRGELIQYFQMHNVELPVEELKEEEINIVEFIKRYQHYM